MALDLLKRLPFDFVGTLHDVELVQFSLEAAEAAAQLPPPLVPRLFGGRAVVSLVSVRLAGMRPSFAPHPFSFSYRHIAFRLLVDDTPLGEEAPRGLFFVRSFTDRPLLARAGALLTPYRLTAAAVTADAHGLAVRQGDRHLGYRKLADREVPASPGLFGTWDGVRAVLGRLDRAYAVDARRGIWRTRILRPAWPLEPLAVEGFATSFFASARCECACRVPEPIPYRWLAPVKVA